MNTRTFIGLTLVSVLGYLATNIQPVTCGAIVTDSPTTTVDDATTRLAVTATDAGDSDASTTTSVPADGSTSMSDDPEEVTSTMKASTTELMDLFEIEAVYVALIGMGVMILLMLVIIIVIMCRYVRPSRK